MTDYKDLVKRLKHWRKRYVEFWPDAEHSEHIKAMDEAADAIEALSAQQVPQGWRFCTADFSVMASGGSDRGSVMLVRAPAEKAAWLEMSEELKESDDGPPLYVCGYGMTMAEALADASQKALAAAAPQPPKEPA